jgi:hypothetical protein
MEHAMRVRNRHRDRRLTRLALFSLLLMIMPSAPFPAPMPGKAQAAAVVKPRLAAKPAEPGFNQESIHALYLEGDFDKATVLLEQAFAQHAIRTHDDSVFAYKHLGVMNAASDDTREKGKYYMIQLLQLEPTAKILDMYASDMIYMIYKNIKEEFEENRRKLRTAESHMIGNHQATASPKDSVVAQAAAASTLEPKPPEHASKSGTREKEGFFRGRRAYYWIGGAGAAVAGIALANYLAGDASNGKKVIYEVD